MGLRLALFSLLFAIRVNDTSRPLCSKQNCLDSWVSNFKVFIESSSGLTTGWIKFTDIPLLEDLYP